ncbi:tRNA (adenosine(37)-N6)-threonylcarbamoyltransferase complex dimerization subunit type 1 TsaB [Mucilaginibacter terrenus]|uniref:tRNA (Adenosine(37)-N6)-threonylcarbamoyltransferase complex dimerization subunit type 1 TsaB n=1 Tax=Mucilaginibacter terrenus TaxID=2482727 RepID=A0A3E2NTI1_9SPHI|nr:tRNA (adenosine(37)-N6)-threonylcarbamoyltransferase complex dimerization subunit type 1 TsaB [Mucilaginibacter terrenus]RFZ84316.1 tRNA (adenosine(37)-N6)-threonylcarbamoyltransferase complex dimerization subunit type 1 TsaB [Mucilaginibacter terrenus]
MGYIIQIETATTSCSAALTNNGVIVGVKEVTARNIHAEVLTLFIDELIAAAGITYTNVDAVAVSCGPGSYTGLRIGVSTAKGLCFALDKPLIAVETLSSMAAGVAADVAGDVLLCPMIDARRMEVYTAVYNKAGDVIKPTAAEIITPESFADLLADNKVLFFGDGAEKCREVLGTNANASFLDGFSNSAAHLTKIAEQKLLARDFEDVAYFEPYYLKDFIVLKKQ